MLARRTFTHLGAAASLSTAGLVSSRRARAAEPEFSYKLACSPPADDPVVVFATKVVERIKQQTDGRLVINVFPNSQLGSENGVLSGLRSGGIEFATAPSNVLGNLTVMAQLSDVGFAYPDYETAWRSLDGELGAIVRREVGKFGITLLDKVWDSGFRQVYSNGKPVESARDFVGLKIRVPVTPITFSMFKYMGASPTTISFNELYSALQMHLVDAMETALVPFLHAKLYEVQKNCSLTNHAWGNYWIGANTAALRRLPKDLQDIMIRNFNDAADEQRQFSKKEDQAAVDQLKRNGMAINTPSDPASFREVLRKSGYYQFWQQKFGTEPWAVLEKYTGKLA